MQISPRTNAARRIRRPYHHGNLTPMSRRPADSSNRRALSMRHHWALAWHDAGNCLAPMQLRHLLLGLALPLAACTDPGGGVDVNTTGDIGEGPGPEGGCG